jgi:hypothetical protein
MLDSVVETLRWQFSEQTSLDTAEENYTSVLAQALGAKLRELYAQDQGRGEEIQKLLTGTDAASLRGVLLAPETSTRVLWNHPGACDDRDIWHYLDDVLTIEQIRSGCSREDVAIRSFTSWSALGDFFLSEEGIIIAQTPISGLVIDAASPAATCFKSSNALDQSLQLSCYTDLSLKAKALSCFQAAMDGLEAVDTRLAAFVRKFTRVANLIVDADGRFSSGSTGEYVGRSIFCNAHSSAVDAGILAEALVHESIHSLLYMHETCEPWVASDDLRANDAVVVSPWTGVRLPLRNYLQACFVWFGLAEFWSMAHGSDAFPVNQCVARYKAAARGFNSAPLGDNIASFQMQIAPELLDKLRLMQSLRQDPDGRNNAKCANL